MISLSAAEVSLWIAHLAVAEARALDCRDAGQAARADELLALSRELHDRARELDSSDTLWERGIGKWTAEVKPAAHCATPMSAAERKRVYQSRDCADACAGICPKCFGWIELRGQESGASEACTCPECPTCAAKQKTAPKPSRRRGTKPASLAQTLHAACHTLKEP